MTDRGDRKRAPWRALMCNQPLCATMDEDHNRESRSSCELPTLRQWQEVKVGWTREMQDVVRARDPMAGGPYPVARGFDTTMGPGAHWRGYLLSLTKDEV